MPLNCRKGSQKLRWSNSVHWLWNGGQIGWNNIWQSYPLYRIMLRLKMIKGLRFEKYLLNIDSFRRVFWESQSFFEPKWSPYHRSADPPRLIAIGAAGVNGSVAIILCTWTSRGIPICKLKIDMISGFVCIRWPDCSLIKIKRSNISVYDNHIQIMNLLDLSYFSPQVPTSSQSTWGRSPGGGGTALSVFIVWELEQKGRQDAVT